MAEKITKTNWKTTDNRFVAFLDLLGFKDKVMRKSHDEIYNELSKISSYKKKLEESIKAEIITRNFNDIDIYIVSFSDSIVLFSKNDSLDNFKFFTIALKSLFSKAIKNKIALKGGIAHGTISVNKSEQIYFGQPIIDAYLIEEDVNYLGIVCHNSIDIFLNENTSSELIRNSYKFIETPLKSGHINHYNLDFYHYLIEKEKRDLEDNEKIMLIKKTYNDFYTTVSGSPRRYIDNSLNLLNKMNHENLILLNSVKLKD